MPLRIERPLHLPHQLEAGVAHLLPQPRLLRQADAVLAGDRAAELERPLDDLFERLRRRGAFRRRRVRRSGTSGADCRRPCGRRCRSADRCSRAVSAMKRTMPASSLRGTVTSSRIVVGRDARQRGEGVAARRRPAAAPRPRPPPCARRARRWRRAIASICAAFVGHGGRMAVGLHQQHRLGSRSAGRPARSPRRSIVVMRSRNSSVQGMIFAAMMADTVSGRVLDPVVERQHRPPRRRPRHQLEQHLGDDPERAFGLPMNRSFSE